MRPHFGFCVLSEVEICSATFVSTLHYPDFELEAVNADEIRKLNFQNMAIRTSTTTASIDDFHTTQETNFEFQSGAHDEESTRRKPNRDRRLQCDNLMSKKKKRVKIHTANSRYKVIVRVEHA